MTMTSSSSRLENESVETNNNNDNAISSIFIVAPRGDVIIKREYRKDVPENQAEIFFRLVKFWGTERNKSGEGFAGAGGLGGKENENSENIFGEGEDATSSKHSSAAPPTFNDQGVNYLHVKANGVCWSALQLRNKGRGQLEHMCSSSQLEHPDTTTT